LRNWEALKALEKEKKRKRRAAEDRKAKKPGAADEAESVLAGVSSKMPALMEAYKLSSRAAHVGFDWPEMEGLFAKLEEETSELREELKAVPFKGRHSGGTGIAGSGKPQVAPEVRERLEDEVGDLFFVLVNIARYLSLDPESALRKTNRKFKRRFQWMEERCGRAGEGRSRLRWTNWKHYGNRRSSRKNGERIASRITEGPCRRGDHPQVRSAGGDAGVLCAAERSVEVFGCGPGSGAPVRGGKRRSAGR
jgi:NTP pyrophosphatase (non-canonical NTP hydrolase)